jgi:hypothetical protein
VRFLLALTGLCLVAAPRVARADDVVGVAPEAKEHSRVVLVSMPDPVFAATAAALGPWSIAVEATPEATPGSDAAASAIAQAHGATAVAWLEGDVLVIYDDLQRRSERREHATPAGRIDDASAASIALSIKTTLRQPTPVVVAAVEPPPPPVEVIEIAAPPPLLAEPQPQLHVAARIGAGIPLADPSPTTARAAVRATYDIAGALAIGLGVEGGVARTIEAEEFQGRYRDLALAAGVEYRIAIGERFWLVPSAAATVHLTRLQGDVTAPMERPVDRSSYPFGAEAELAAETGGRLRAGAAIFGTFLTGRDAYKVHGADVLRVPAVSVGIALRMSWQ